MKISSSFLVLCVLMLKESNADDTPKCSIGMPDTTTECKCGMGTAQVLGGGHGSMLAGSSALARMQLEKDRKKEQNKSGFKPIASPNTVCKNGKKCVNIKMPVVGDPNNKPGHYCYECDYTRGEEIWVSPICQRRKASDPDVGLKWFQRKMRAGVERKYGAVKGRQSAGLLTRTQLFNPSPHSFLPGGVSLTLPYTKSKQPRTGSEGVKGTETTPAAVKGSAQEPGEPQETEINIDFDYRDEQEITVDEVKYVEVELGNVITREVPMDKEPEITEATKAVVAALMKVGEWSMIGAQMAGTAAGQAAIAGGKYAATTVAPAVGKAAVAAAVAVAPVAGKAAVMAGKAAGNAALEVGKAAVANAPAVGSAALEVGKVAVANAPAAGSAALNVFEAVGEGALAGGKLATSVIFNGGLVAASVYSVLKDSYKLAQKQKTEAEKQKVIAAAVASAIDNLQNAAPKLDDAEEEVVAKYVLDAIKAIQLDPSASTQAPGANEPLAPQLDQKYTQAALDAVVAKATRAPPVLPNHPEVESDQIMAAVISETVNQVNSMTFKAACKRYNRENLLGRVYPFGESLDMEGKRLGAEAYKSGNRDKTIVANIHEIEGKNRAKLILMYYQFKENLEPKVEYRILELQLKIDDLSMSRQSQRFILTLLSCIRVGKFRNQDIDIAVAKTDGNFEVHHITKPGIYDSQPTKYEVLNSTPETITRDSFFNDYREFTPKSWC